MNTPNSRLRELAEAACSDTLADEQVRELEQLLRGDAEACRYYLSYCWMHAGLRDAISTNRAMDGVSRTFEAVDESTAGQTPRQSAPDAVPGLIASEPRPSGSGFGPIVSEPRPSGSGFDVPASASATLRARLGIVAVSLRHAWRQCQHHPIGMLVTLAAATMLVVLLASEQFQPRLKQREADRSASASSASASSAAVPLPASQFVARLTRAYACRWVNPESAPTVGSTFDVDDQLALTSGAAELTFVNGVKAVVQGPCTLIFNSALSVQMPEGAVAVRVPPNAIGFTVHVPGIRVVDWGTEFGVAVDSTGAREVHVFDGQVEVEFVGDGNRAGSATSAVATAVPEPNDSGPLEQQPPFAWLSKNAPIFRTERLVTGEGVWAEPGTAGLVHRGSSVEGRFLRAMPADLWRIPVASYAYTSAIQPTSAVHPGKAESEHDLSRMDPKHAKLTDGVVATRGLKDGRWVGFGDPLGFEQDDEQSQPQIDFNFELPVRVHLLRIAYAVDFEGSVYAPDELRITLSADEEFDESDPVIVERSFDRSRDLYPALLEGAVRFATVDLGGATVRRVRLEFYNSGQWTYLSEIEFLAAKEDARRDDKTTKFSPGPQTGKNDE